MAIRLWGVYVNSDMTEGRGPMVLDSIFLDKSQAIAYFNLLPGIMGRSPVYVNTHTGEKYNGWMDWDYGDWRLKELWAIEPGEIVDHAKKAR